MSSDECKHFWVKLEQYDRGLALQMEYVVDALKDELARLSSTEGALP